MHTELSAAAPAATLEQSGKGVMVKAMKSHQT